MFDSYGFTFVRVYIKHKETPIMPYFSYKVDTGANLTTISFDTLSELGYNKEWIMSGTLLKDDGRPTLASGEFVDDCYRIVLPEINIGGCVGYNWPFLTSLSVPFRLLLGTDSMCFFNWVFDYERGICKFELIQNKRQLLFNRLEQSIHSVVQ